MAAKPTLPAQGTAFDMIAAERGWQAARTPDRRVRGLGAGCKLEEASLGGGRRMVVTVIMVAAALVTACTHPAARQAQAVRLAVCEGTPQAQPTVVVISCADNGIIARDLAWSNWGRPVATAEGRAVVDLCAAQDCFNPNDHDYPVVLIAWGTQQCPKGLRSYRRLQYVFAGRSPFQTVPTRLMSANQVPQPAQVITVPCP